jgi:hypothetical protein
MTTAEQIDTEQEHPPEAFEVMVSYLPAAHAYHHRYVADTVVEKVRTDSMAFFHVHDHQERDTYRYFLEFGGVRITDTSQTLAHLAAHHHHHGDELHFNLVEEITPGSAS